MSLEFETTSTEQDVGFEICGYGQGQADDRAALLFHETQPDTVPPNLRRQHLHTTHIADQDPAVHPYGCRLSAWLQFCLICLDTFFVAPALTNAFIKFLVNRLAWAVQCLEHYGFEFWRLIAVFPKHLIMATFHPVQQFHKAVRWESSDRVLNLGNSRHALKLFTTRRNASPA